MRILVADDDADLRALIGFTLMQAGFDICTAVDGESALQAFHDSLMPHNRTAQKRRRY